MSLETIIQTSQDYLLQTGEAITVEASIPEMIETLARLCPVFGSVGVLYNRWAMGSYLDASQAYVDQTSAAQGPGDLSLTTTTANDGLLIGAAGAFDRVTFTLTTPSSPPTAVEEWTYWNGWQWAPLSARSLPTFAAGGTQALVFEPPDDWTRGVPTGLLFPEGVVQDYFWLRMRATTPPTIPAIASSLDLTQRFFPLPETVLQLLSVHYFPRELEPAGVRWAQDTLDPAWRTRTGTPTRYTQELETTRRLRLYPSPTQQGPEGIPPFQGIPGAMVPTNHLVTMTLVAPDVADLSPWWEDLVAYLLVAWESIREGVQQDLSMAQTMQTLVGMLVALLKDLQHAPGEELIETAWQMPLWQNLPLT